MTIDTSYAYAIGFNRDLEDLTPADPQPFSRMMRTPERRKSLARTTSTQGVKQVRWLFNAPNLEELDTLMSGHGITFDNPSGEVTIYTVINTATAGVQNYARCNAIVTGPNPDDMKVEPGDQDHWGDVVFTYDIIEVL